ncbi:MAG: TusE/DsrC/DsvC family sulfur relay protein [bacterium]|nr:TusE/DsrC/DsvC family sulfur relay protein [bacterium]
MSFEVNGKTIETDEDGYLKDMTEWSKEAAEYLAKSEDVDMTEAHWDLVDFLRDYYAQYQIAPMVKILTKEIAKKNGIEKKEASKMLYDLFPAGPAKQACKIAGLPKPTGCV